MKTKWINLLFIVALLGCFAFGYLTLRHFEVLYGGGTGSFCNLSETVNCDVVNTSSYAELFGIPISILGLCTFIFFIILLFALKVVESTELAFFKRFFTLLTGLALGYSLWLLAVQFFVLQTFCIVCIAADLAALLLFVGALSLSKGEKFASYIEDIKSFLTLKRKGLLIGLAVIPLASLFLNSVLTDSYAKDSGKYIEKYVADWKNQTPKQIDVSDAALKGDESAPITLIEFADYQCPACKSAALPLKTFVDGNKGKVKLYFLNYPLNSACNEKVKTAMHPQSCEMAKLTECAKGQNKFWEAYYWVFEHQEELGKLSSESVATSIGLDWNQIKTCMEDPKITDRIRSHVDRGTAAGVSGTPSVFVNGKYLQGGFSIPVLKRALDL